MPNDLASVTAAINAGFDALAHVPPRPVTVVPSIADTLLPVETQLELTRILGPIPSPYFFSTGGVNVAGPYKVVWTIYGADNCAWTETYYTNTGTNPYIIGEGINPLATLRAAFLATPFTIGVAKVSDVTIPRKSYPVKVGIAGMAPITTPPGLGPPEIALVYRLYTGNGDFVNHFFRGWPGNQINNPSGNGIFNPPSLNTAVYAFGAALAGAGYGWQPITPATKVPGGQFAKNPIKTVDGTLSQNFPIVTCLNLIQPASQALCNISGCNAKNLPGLKGTWQMFNVNGNTFQIQYTTPVADVIPSGGGSMRNNQRAGFNTFAVPAGFTQVANFHGQGQRAVKNLFGRGRRARYAPGIRTLA